MIFYAYLRASFPFPGARRVVLSRSDILACAERVISGQHCNPMIPEAGLAFGGGVVASYGRGEAEEYTVSTPGECAYVAL